MNSRICHKNVKKLLYDLYVDVLSLKLAMKSYTFNSSANSRIKQHNLRSKRQDPNIGQNLRYYFLSSRMKQRKRMCFDPNYGRILLNFCDVGRKVGWCETKASILKLLLPQQSPLIATTWLFRLVNSLKRKHFKIITVMERFSISRSKKCIVKKKRFLN